MSYIGHAPTNAGQFVLLDDIETAGSPGGTFNGILDTFNMKVSSVSVSPSADNLLIMLSGIVQETPGSYTVSGSTIVFDDAPETGMTFYGILMGQSASVGAGTITTAEMAANSVDSDQYVDGSIDNAHLADMAANTVKVRDANSSGVPSDKAVADTQLLIGDGTGFTAAALSGDVTMANSGAVTIAQDAVDIGMISATGTASSSTFLRGDNAWVAVTDTNTQYPTAVATKTDNYTVTTDDLGKSLRMNNGSSDYTFTLPSVGAGEDGGRITFTKLGSGTVTIDAADSDIISNSGAGDTIYAGRLGETFANVTLEYVHSTTQWIIVGAHGTWVSTD